MKTTAKLSEDGTHYVLNGAKTFITGGVHADRVDRLRPHLARRPPRTAAAASPSSSWTPSPRATRSAASWTSSACSTSDTAELSFTDVKVPVEDLLGEEGKGFSYLGHNLPQERLGIAVGAYAQAAAAVQFAKEYVQERTVFGKTVAVLPEHQVRAGRLRRPRWTPPRPSSTAPWRPTTPAS